MTRKIDIVLTEDFPILSVTLITEPLRVANRESLRQAFDWRLVSVDGGAMTSSSGIDLMTGALDDAPADVVLLLSSYHPESAVTPPLIKWLKKRARAGVLMGCVDTGALIFARAGLLLNHPAAAHFESLPGYHNDFPESMFVDRLYDFNPPRCSSAGGVATMDMTLAMIAHFTSSALATRVTEILTYLPSGDHQPQERLISGKALKHVNRQLAEAVDVMISNMADPMPITAIATRLNLADWQLHRLFKRYLRTTPGAYFLQLRLERARDFLKNSHHSVGEIGSLCGFENHETFTRAYKRQFRVPPSHERKHLAPHQ